MTRLLAVAAIWTALLLSVYGVSAAIAGARKRSDSLVRSAELAAYANAVLLAIANTAMIYALVTHDFSISYVAQVGSRSTPIFFTVISLWSALEGSILFWGLILSAYTAAAVYFTRRRLGTLSIYAMAVMLGVSFFFYLLLVGPANPFHLMSPVPTDGPGPNPLLQNHPLMAIHPPFLYLGYVGMTVPFAFAIGALISGKLDDVWIRTTRRWTVASWMFLTLAIVAGMWWSYEVLGWGGYWAWDPVENASFMPWLTATAFLHSVMVQERRGMLRVWNLSLIIATFVLTILGTFLTRSGILSSVHAFSEGPIGLFFLAFIAVVLLFSMVLLAGRGGELKSQGRLDSAASRETVFMINNLVLAAFCFTVLLGTLFPLVAEAARGVKVSVGAPFFNKMTVPLAVMLLFLVGVGPALPWRSTTREQLKRELTVPGIAFLIAAMVALVLGAKSPFTVLAFGFAAFGMISNVLQFDRGAVARRRNLGENGPQSLYRLLRATPRRYGGYIAHMGVLLLVFGVAASSSFKTEREATLTPGQTMEIGKYTLRFNQLWGKEEPHRVIIGADLQILKGGRDQGIIDPRMNYYATRDEPVPTPRVRSRATHDLYANLMAFERDGSSATVHVWIQPFVMWIWTGGLIMALGAIIALLPAARRQVRRRPAELHDDERRSRVAAEADEEMEVVA
ncbi:MAG TPA: heme lyase CcmF/NrfE family subunit [Longimicrobiales bacterium]